MKGSEMPPFQNHTRISVQDLKAQMVKRIGPERASQYFGHFKGYISLRFSKTELDKLVVMTIGKENIGLHNKIIKAILTNAINCDAPPQTLAVQDTSKPTKCVPRKSLSSSNNAPKKLSIAGSLTCFSNGAVCKEPLRGEEILHLNQSSEKEKASKHAEGTNHGVDTARPLEHTCDAAQQYMVNSIDVCSRFFKRPRIIIPSSPDTSLNRFSSDEISLSVVDSRHTDVRYEWENDLIKTPRGISIKSRELSSPTKLSAIHLSDSSSLRSRDGKQESNLLNNLPSTELVHCHMEHIAAIEGLEGVNQKCAEILNAGIEAFLKRLISSCIDLVESRSLVQHGTRSERQAGNCDESGSNQIEPHDYATQKEAIQDDSSCPNISFLDFTAAMESNPRQLGYNWPLQLERLQLYLLNYL
ncbi:hypothetical protein KP509_25G007200 [Ceratopteris richardii]|uniref:Uncharacterized protein n=1 Tax=Ceratopteris richardii TaxID=49495 RepID=A0A8T2RMI2_CERRI|nr:hypothetical protein KP509_25G007200 [Ceratopteris richardii]KAH7297690.1 hypothetical protein KP509_25G007200 [Ceratopteris richardii]KAH7297691.1 hypothetical protein KP509_25G007200 [Ceratopteris richardii]KAH7297692.1 hypothetical protein KP509_25G007200 [Ceratopteris richardii]